MDRTVQLNDKWYYSDGEKVPVKKAPFMKATAVLPLGSKGTFTLRKKFICPKQVNDTVKIYFTGSFRDMKVYAGKNALKGEKDSVGNKIFDVTPFIGRGIVIITATFSGGQVDGFYYSVKRKV